MEAWDCCNSVTQGWDTRGTYVICRASIMLRRNIVECDKL